MELGKRFTLFSYLKNILNHRLKDIFKIYLRPNHLILRK